MSTECNFRIEITRGTTVDVKSLEPRGFHVKCYCQTVIIPGEYLEWFKDSKGNILGKYFKDLTTAAKEKVSKATVLHKDCYLGVDKKLLPNTLTTLKLRVIDVPGRGRVSHVQRGLLLLEKPSEIKL